VLLTYSFQFSSAFLLRRSASCRVPGFPNFTFTCSRKKGNAFLSWSWIL